MINRSSDPEPGTHPYLSNPWLFVLEADVPSPPSLGTPAYPEPPGITVEPALPGPEGTSVLPADLLLLLALP